MRTKRPARPPLHTLRPAALVLALAAAHPALAQAV